MVIIPTEGGHNSPATPTVAAPAPMNLAAESTSWTCELV